MVRDNFNIDWPSRPAFEIGAPTTPFTLGLSQQQHTIPLTDCVKGTRTSAGTGGAVGAGDISRPAGLTGPPPPAWYGGSIAPPAQPRLGSQSPPMPPRGVRTGSGAELARGIYVGDGGTGKGAGSAGGEFDAARSGAANARAILAVHPPPPPCACRPPSPACLQGDDEEGEVGDKGPGPAP